MEHPSTKKPNMFGGGTQKPTFQLNRPAVTRPQVGFSKGSEAGTDLRSSVNDGESTLRSDSKLSESRNKPFVKFGGPVVFSRPESKIKIAPEDVTAPVLETAVKPKVNFTGEIKARPKKKDDNFFDDPMPDPKVQKQAKPNLMKSLAPGEQRVEERKTKEKNFFDDEFDDVQLPVKDTMAKPNLGKPRAGPSMSVAQSQMRASVNPREERPENPYEEFEVLSHEQG